MSGIFLGLTHGGLQTGNTMVALEHSVRFRAERSMNLLALRWENRLLTEGNVQGRSGPLFEACRDANLSPDMCGYTLGNSYHVGNGGHILATLHPDDGHGRPDESLELGRVREHYVPAHYKHGVWITQHLTKPVKVIAGNLYHVRLQNLAPADLPLNRNSVEAARLKDPDTGAISLNGIWHGEYVGPEGLRWGPYYGRLGQGTLYRNSSDESWIERKHTYGWLELLYEDGVWSGAASTGYDNIRTSSVYKGSAYDGFKIIEGERRARQVFTLEHRDVIIDGLWLNFSHTPTADMTPLSVTLEADDGELLAEGLLNASPEVLERVVDGMENDTLHAINANTWGYTTLPATRLQHGRRYYLILSADAGAGFHINSFFPVTDDNRNEWREAYAQVNEGDGWNRYDTSNGHARRDLPIMFTLEGMPRRLP